MSGVEAAGLVLGAIPLIISALEHYEDVAAPTVAFMHWKRYLRRLVQELYIIRASYDQAIQLLLAPISDLSNRTLMMEDPRSRLWREGDIANSLRDRLGAVYDPFILTIDEIEEILVDIVSSLNIPGSQQVVTSRTLWPVVSSNLPIASTPNLRMNFEFRQRIKFTMKKNRVKTSLERLEACTSRIDAWVARADKLQEETPQNRLKLKFSASLDTIQENASKIYRAISRNWCTDKPVHVARLLLEQRLVRSKKRKRPSQPASVNVVAQASCFGLSLHGDCCASSGWLNSEIRIDELPSSQTTIRVTISVPGTAADEPISLQSITNFCKIIREPIHPFVGFSLDDMGCLKSYSSKATVEHVQQSLSLEDLLPRFKDKLPYESVYGLAITLVASILQLSQTPWLESKWSKKCILFSRASDNLPLSVDLKYPYLANSFHCGELGPYLKFSSIAAESGNPAAGHQRPDDAPETNSNLLTLAIMLLEINSGQPVEQRRRDAQMATTQRRPDGQTANTQSNEHSDLQLADKWLKEEKSRGRISCAFSQAILTCLQDYLNPDASFADEAYCAAFKEKALVPLEEEMECLLYGPPR
ncbi:uncharacterized protein Z520_10613 [Fonsecaea multimorphosa CBS 102226]|uniref:DUF7580 domain-containing protein n=1 Tax=Fonsecaea multimorphosa CBS 102226 TaxID=1442371 RepID=A0A0D2JKA7_9EURO|nr:uncharacterized protein Z520_10613 [Fonsecaea multimorphosa CBS 102226]KIX93707.1 hypothetical protein Z520_10613 [Fonsecaea multimorphosa CBS 102226]OAL19816.1 hypothetical protein AYO22_09343 [Fonsecaea multimorphosa]